MKKVGFSQEQIKYLQEMFNQKKKELLEEVNKDNFEGDDKAFNKLCDKLLNVNDLQVDKSKKSSKKKTKKAKKGYMKWLWSKDGMPTIKEENNNAEQKVLFKEAGKKWAKMSDAEKKKYD